MTEEEEGRMDLLSRRLSDLTQALIAMNTRQTAADKERKVESGGIHEHLTMIHNQMREFHERGVNEAPRRSAMMPPGFDPTMHIDGRAPKGEDWVLSAKDARPEKMIFDDIMKARSGHDTIRPTATSLKMEDILKAKRLAESFKAPPLNAGRSSPVNVTIGNPLKKGKGRP